jgi:ABC-type Fe3+/spermidine/putrescine transport system ATPase subunit
VLLLDEPLGALDLKLRRQMQDELVRLKKETGATFVHVTHDQEEACAIADRIAIMDKGRIIQIDTPLALYRHPRTSYVARFIDVGTVLRGDVSRSNDIIELASPQVSVRGRAPRWLKGPTPLAAVLPHDRIAVTPADGRPGAGDSGLHGVVDRIVFTGSVFDIVVRAQTGLEVRAASSDNAFASVTPGTPVALSWDPDDVIFVEDSETEPSLALAA